MDRRRVSVRLFFARTTHRYRGSLRHVNAISPTNSIFGTFENHNALATYLVFAWVVIVATGWSGWVSVATSADAVACCSRS